MTVNSRILVFVIVKRTRAFSYVSCTIEAIKLLLLLLSINTATLFWLEQKLSQKFSYSKNNFPHSHLVDMARVFLSTGHQINRVLLHSSCLALSISLFRLVIHKGCILLIIPQYSILYHGLWKTMWVGNAAKLHKNISEHNTFNKPLVMASRF